MTYNFKQLQSYSYTTSITKGVLINLGKGKQQVILIICFLFFAVTAFADVPGGGIHWPSQTIKFTNLSSLNCSLHLLDDFNSESSRFIFTNDTTYFIPAHGGSPGNGVAFFGLLVNKSTDTITLQYFDGDTEIYFTGIKNNKLQFIKKKLEGGLESETAPNSADEEEGFWKTDKLLYGLSITALIGLVLCFIFFKRKQIRAHTNPDI